MKIGQSRSSKYEFELSRQSQAEMRRVAQPEAVAGGCSKLGFLSFRSLDQNNVKMVKKTDRKSTSTP